MHSILAELYTISWEDPSFGLWHTTCWIGDCHIRSSILAVHFLKLFTVSNTYFFLSAFDVFLRVSMAHSSVFTVQTIILIFSFRSRRKHLKPLCLQGSFVTLLCPPRSICHHVHAKRYPWGWPLVIALPDTLGKRGQQRKAKWDRAREQKREITWQRPWNRSVPLSRARGVCSQVVSTSH